MNKLNGILIKKTGNRTALWSSNPTAGHIHRGNQNWKRHVYPNVHRSTVYNSQDIEATYMPISRWMDKKAVVQAIKKNTFESVLMRWMKLEPNIQSEVSQKEKYQYSILMHIYGI